MRTQLPVKQEKFVHGVLKGLSLAEAYRQAGYKNSSAATVGTCAAQLAQTPRVSSLIAAGRAKATKDNIASLEEQEAWLSKLMRGEIPETPVNVRLAANEQLGKRHGAFVSRTEVSGAAGTPLVVTLIGTSAEVYELASMSDKEVTEK